MSGGVTAKEIKDSLRSMHGFDRGTGEWVCVDEAFSGLSAGGGIDLLAIGVWLSSSHPALDAADLIVNQRARRIYPTYPYVAYEVKVSRSDFARELKAWPEKAGHAMRRCHYYLFATPAGLLKEEEIERSEPSERVLWLPSEAGLVEVDGSSWTVRKPAPFLAEPAPFSRLEVAELIRHAVDPAPARKDRADSMATNQSSEDSA